MEIQSYHKFWQRIHKSAKSKGLPVRVMFELTYRCNFFCPHCYVPQNYRKKRELKTKEVFLILDELRDIGCFYLGFTGGEPFLRDDIFDILLYAKECGFEIIIYSNGSLIDKDAVKELSRLRPNKVDITIPAMSEAAFEKITGVGGCRNKVFQAIELLRKHKVNLGFKSCVLKDNETEIAEIQEFAHSLGALHRLDDRLSRRLNGSDKPFLYRGRLGDGPHALRLTPYASRLTPHVKEEFVECNQEDKGSAACNVQPVTLFRCGVGKSQAAITPQGELKPCLMLDEPRFKISDDSLRDAWNKLKEFIKNIKPDKNYECNGCNLADYCKWCPAKSRLYNRTFTSCEPQSRKKAEWVRRI